MTLHIKVEIRQDGKLIHPVTTPRPKRRRKPSATAKIVDTTKGTAVGGEMSPGGSRAGLLKKPR